MRFLRSAGAGLVVVLLAASVGLAADTPEDAGQKAADAWLKLVDGGKYADSWDAASALFKTAVTRDQWAQAASAVRSSTGALQSRKFKSRTFSTTLPGAPAGQYVTILYDSAFAQKASAVETFVAMQDTDGAWRAAGYFVR